jgi:RNA polymerase sigma-70 factor (ECF subfamily)
MIFRMVLDAQLVETDPEVESKAAREAASDREAGRDGEAASDVIEACRRGEAGAFAALFELHRDRVYSIALRFSGDPSVALDITQETFLKLLSKIREFRGEASFESWLYRLVVNACLDHRRAGRRWSPLLDGWLGALRASGESVLHQMLRSEVQENVQQVVAKLPPELRMVVILRYTEQLSYDEIAEILGCPQGTVASRLNRAHKLLERRLAGLRNTLGGNHA